jgi:predicted DsbA family dithiol-disulfide isomerase
VIWRAFPLHPGTPDQGMTLEDLFSKKGIPVQVDKMMAQLKATADNLGYELGDRKMTYNSRLAQELGLWAQEKGKGHLFHLNAFKAYFVSGKNLAEKPVLMALIEQSGLDTVEGEQVVDQRTFSDAVDADWELSRRIGVSAVPTFVFGLNRIVGAQPYEAIEKLVHPQ